MYSNLTKKSIISFLTFLVGLSVLGQNNAITINVKLDDTTNELKVQQKIIYYNTSSTKLTSVFLHDWANSFKDRSTPLSDRFIDDYKKHLYFSKPEERGNTSIKNLTVNHEQVSFKRLKKQSDIIEILLNKSLQPNDSVEIYTTYIVKIPHAKFTNYGYTKTGYHLRFWYLVPAVFTKNKWQLMSNLNMDDLFMKASNYEINLTVPDAYTVKSNTYQSEIKNKKNTLYHLITKKDNDIILNIDKESKFLSFNTSEMIVHTDIINREIDKKLATDILNRELQFIKKYLGNYPHKDIFIDRATQKKNPIYGLNQLPSLLRPYSDTFKWDITIFKALAKKYIENTLLLNKRNDYWLIDGLQTYLMMEYTKKYYPEVNLLGKVSKIWGIRSYNFAKLKYNDKYPFVYQFSARKFLDQSLTTRADSLSNFNRSLVNKYKAGLGLRYLNEYLGDSILNKTIKYFYQKNASKITTSNQFKKLLEQRTNKDLSWFFGDFLKTSKKIDYTIKKATIDNDSIKVTIKNKRNFTAPVALYGVQDKKIIFKKWFANIDSTKTVIIPKGNFDRLALNYENLYPEYNSINNFKSLKKRLFNKPLQFRLLKDVENPYYNQIYLQPELRYNYYDGATLMMKFHNRPIIPHNFSINISPAYGTKSKSLTGGASMAYYDYGKEKSSVYRTIYGMSGSYQHYQENLAVKSFSPYAAVEFKRNTLRDVGARSLVFSLSHINKEIPDNQTTSDEDKYTIFNASYFYSKPNIIRGIQYATGIEIADKFSKITGEFRYRKLTNSNTRIEFRTYAGLFLSNKTNSDYFSFGLDRANDYLFRLNYFGRSESSGFFSQQFILAEGGFKSRLDKRFSNQFMLAFNSSIGIWRWIEIYNDVAFLKNKKENIFVGYENGIHLNFIPNILELYLPVYSNNGFEINQPNYTKKLRFVLTLNINAIYGFVRRGFL